MTDLPDINVWLALADENHVQHKRARTYWQNDAPPTVAFCRISMIGFLRLATQSRVLSAPFPLRRHGTSIAAIVPARELSFFRRSKPQNAPLNL